MAKRTDESQFLQSALQHFYTSSSSGSLFFFFFFWGVSLATRYSYFVLQICLLRIGVFPLGGFGGVDPMGVFSVARSWTVSDFWHLLQKGESIRVLDKMFMGRVKVLFLFLFYKIVWCNFSTLTTYTVLRVYF